MEFTYPEIGALLIAIGTEMQRNDVCAGAARDGSADQIMLKQIMKQGVDKLTAEALLEFPTPDAINYIGEIPGIDHGYDKPQNL